MKSVQGARTQVRNPRAKGFTLIELLVVLVILAIAAATTMAGIRQDQFTNAYIRFVADLEGHIIQARALAVDNSSPTQVQVFDDRMFVLERDEINNTWNPVFADWVSVADGGALTELGNDPLRGVCLNGFQSGVMAPEAGRMLSSAAPPPRVCTPQMQVIQFEPDGTFVDPLNTIGVLPGSGATLWISDRRVQTNQRYSIIQIYPGGLIRTFHDVQE